MQRRHFISLGLTVTTGALGLATYRASKRTGHHHEEGDFDAPAASPRVMTKRPRTLDTKDTPRVIFIELEGGNDLYDTLIPLEGNQFRQTLETNRKSLMRPTAQLLPIKDKLGMPSQLKTLHGLMNEGKAEIYKFTADGSYESDWLFPANPEVLPISFWQTLPSFLAPKGSTLGGIPCNPSQYYPLATPGLMPGGMDSMEGKVVKALHDTLKVAKQHQTKYLKTEENHRAQPGEAISIALESISEKLATRFFFSKQPGYNANTNYEKNRDVTLFNLNQAIFGAINDADNLENVTIVFYSPKGRKATLDKAGVPQSDSTSAHMIVVGKKLELKETEKEMLAQVAALIS